MRAFFKIKTSRNFYQKANFSIFYKNTINSLAIESTLLIGVQNALINYYASITNFQLLDVEFPGNFSVAVTDTQVQNEFPDKNFSSKKKNQIKI